MLSADGYYDGSSLVSLRNFTSLRALCIHGVFVTCPLDKFALNAPEKPRRLQSLIVCLLDNDFSIAGEMPHPRIRALKARLDVTGSKARHEKYELGSYSRQHSDVSVLSLV